MGLRHPTSLRVLRLRRGSAKLALSREAGKHPTGAAEHVGARLAQHAAIAVEHGRAQLLSPLQVPPSTPLVPPSTLKAKLPPARSISSAYLPVNCINLTYRPRPGCNVPHMFLGLPLPALVPVAPFIGVVVRGTNSAG